MLALEVAQSRFLNLENFLKKTKMLFCVDGEIGVSEFWAMYADSELNIAVFFLSKNPPSIDIRQVESNFDSVVQGIWNGSREFSGREFVYLDARSPRSVLFSPGISFPWGISMDYWEKIWRAFSCIESVYPNFIRKVFPGNEDAKVLAPFFPVYYVDRDSGGEVD